MTEPVDPHTDEHPDPADGGDAPALDDATVAALQAMLRDEPVQDDELARERRIRAALDAAPAAVPGPGPVPVPRRRAGATRWLVAAAVVSVLGVGGYLFVSVAGSGGYDEATSDMTADSPANGGSDAGRDGTESAPAAEADTAEADTAVDQEGGTAPSTVAPPSEPAMSGAGPVIDLGSFDELGALLAATDEALRSGGTEVGAPFAGDAAPCVGEQLALGQQVVGVATLGGRAVVVVREPAGTRVLAGETCTDLPG